MPWSITSSAYRCISETLDLLAALAPTLDQAVRAASRKAQVSLDGTLPPIDRIAADRPFSSGKHQRHGRNVRVVADPFGRLLWASPALPGAVRDVRAAREHGIVIALDQARIPCWADKGYQGARGTVRVPFRGRCNTLSAGQQAVNRSHAKIRARRTSCGHPQALAAPPRTPLLDHPHHGPRPGHPHPASRQLNRRLKRPPYARRRPRTPRFNRLPSSRAHLGR